MHTVFIYYDAECKDQVREEADILLEKYQGILGIIMLDV